jgi:uncharacterized protein YbjQ (UPF0145 family)
MSELWVTTTFGFEGYRVTRHLGVVRGIIVRSPTISQGILGGLKSMVGGQIGAFTEMCEQARRQAYELLIEHAVQLGANAVVGFRYDASHVAESSTEVLCYGTAVVIEQVRAG